MFGCGHCSKEFTTRGNLNKHVRLKHEHPKELTCSKCHKKYRNKKSLNKHLRSHKYECVECHKLSRTKQIFLKHELSCIRKREETLISDNENVQLCEVCQECYPKRQFASHLRSEQHRSNALQAVDEDCFVYKTSLKGQLVIYRIPNKKADEDIELSAKIFMNTVYPCVQKVLNAELIEKKLLKFRCVLVGLFTKPNDLDEDESYEQAYKHFQSSYQLLAQGYDIDNLYNIAIGECVNDAEEFNEVSSGWSVIRYIHLDLEICKIELIRGSSYIPLPQSIVDKKCCINVKNTRDSKCFLYSILSGVYYSLIPKYSRQSPEAYKDFLDHFNTSGITFPVSIKDIRKFEAQNDRVSINVFALEKEQVVGPLYVTKQEKPVHINLLYIENRRTAHYVFIKSLSRLLTKANSKHNGRVYYCNSCLSGFNRGQDLQLHHEIGCGKVRPRLPISKPYLEFTNIKSKQTAPFVIYGDLESILPKYDTAEPNPQISFTTEKQLHVPASYAYSIKSIVKDRDLEDLRICRGKDCLDHFVLQLQFDVRLIYERYLKVIQPKEPLTDEIVKRLDLQTECHLCGVAFGPRETKVVDHCHITQTIRGYAHSKCNLQCQTPRFITFFTHAGSSYDMHLLILALSTNKIGRLTCLPKSGETYISFSVRIEVEDNVTIEVRFLDSYRFLPESISTLTESLKICPEYIKFHEKNFPNTNFWVNPQKQFLCYEYITDFEKFSETELPSIEKFYSSLTNKSISQQEYEHAKLVFENLKDKTLGGYIDYYLATDVYLLQDVMESYRESCLKLFKIDLVFHYTTAGLSFDACLQHTKKRVPLLTDITMINLVQRNIRGGVSSAILRHSESNNKYLKGGYKPELGPPVYNSYCDANGLYTKIMLDSYLPDGEYSWLKGAEFERVKSGILDIARDADYGYLVLADFDIPPEKHDYFNDLPFLAESVKIGKTQKLVPNLFPKRNYLTHYLVLQQCVKYGVVLRSIHKIIKFRQTNWLRSYIQMLADLRRDVSNSAFQVRLWKNLSNCIYGKMIQNCENYREVKLVKSYNASGGARNCASLFLRSPRFKNFTIFNENLASVELQRVKVFYNRPSIVGMVILELSKERMYEFIYGTLKRYMDPYLTISYFDTDGFIISGRGEGGDMYELMKTRGELFDTSDFPENNPYGITPQNRRICGLYHDEGRGQPLLRFIALRAKSYYVVFQDGDKERSIKKLKSVSRSVTQTLEFKDYEEVWRQRSTSYARMMRIYSRNHILRTVLLNKRALRGDDDKRYLLPDNIHTLALGHKDIPTPSH